MPEVVKAYTNRQDIFEVRSIQKQILSDYRRDFSKHVPSDLLPKVNMVWDSIPAQLAKENKKYNVYPIEVKAEENLKSKSLKTVYMENNNLHPIRFSMANYREQEWLTNVPLYLTGEWIDIIN